MLRGLAVLKQRIILSFIIYTLSTSATAIPPYFNSNPLNLENGSSFASVQIYSDNEKHISQLEFRHGLTDKVEYIFPLSIGYSIVDDKVKIQSGLNSYVKTENSEVFGVNAGITGRAYDSNVLTIYYDVFWYHDISSIDDQENDLFIFSLTPSYLAFNNTSLYTSIDYYFADSQHQSDNKTPAITIGANFRASDYLYLNASYKYTDKPGVINYEDIYFGTKGGVTGINHSLFNIGFSFLF